jgi:hypothetical protein
MVNPEQLISSQNIHELCYYQGVILFCKPLLKQELGSATRNLRVCFEKIIC